MKSMLWLMALVVGCGSKLDTKYTDEGVAAAKELCACSDAPDEDAFTACATRAKQRLGAATAEMAERGYFDEHSDHAQVKAFRDAEDRCRTIAAEARAMLSKRAASGSTVPVIDAKTAAIAADVLDADKKTEAKARPSKATATTRPSPAKKPSEKPAYPRGARGMGSTTNAAGSAGAQPGPLWANEKP